MDGFVDRLHALRFLRACDPSYGALTFTLVGLPPTGYISLLLDIMFGSFLPSLWSSSNQSVLRSREPTLLCNQVVFTVRAPFWVTSPVPEGRNQGAEGDYGCVHLGTILLETACPFGQLRRISFAP